MIITKYIQIKDEKKSNKEDKNRNMTLEEQLNKYDVESSSYENANSVYEEYTKI